MKSPQFIQEEHLENVSFPLLIEYTDSGEQVYIDDPFDIDDTRGFRVVSMARSYKDEQT